MFKNFNLTDGEVLDIINTYENLINKASVINGRLNAELRETIIVSIYIRLTRNRKK